MNFAINPINSNSISISSSIAAYKQAQSNAQNIASVVYESLKYLTGSNDGISLQNLEDLNQTLNNENLAQSNAYTLVNTLINRFDALSSNGETITQSDFSNAIKFSVAQNYTSDTNLNSILAQHGAGVSKVVSQIFGDSNAHTLALVTFIDSLTDETIGKMISNLNSTSSSSSASSSDSNDEIYKNTSAYQDFRTVTASQLKSPINIAV